MQFKELITKNRSIRRFKGSVPLPANQLKELVDLARLSASGANLQPLKFITISDPAMNRKVFPALAWAGYLKDWDGPAEGERPTGYIVILGDTAIKKSFDNDCGIAAQSITLGAAEKGLGACMIASIKRDGLRQALELPERFEILLVIALGEPAEEVKIEPTGTGGDIRYYRDTDGIHHVPKRPLDEVLLKEI